MISDIYIITARWAEPEKGSSAWMVSLDAYGYGSIDGIIGWIKEHAGDNYGYTLCEWEIHPSRTYSRSDRPCDLDGLDAVLDMIAANSRHNETDIPGEYYGASHPDLETRR